MPTFEANFDGLVGPTHHYAGLAHGNVASGKNAGNIANPQAAALQGLEKMWTLAQMGFTQHVLPPVPRPNLQLLSQLGFTGNNATNQALNENPSLLSAACSASSMWTANAATVSPSADTADGRVHLTVANLNNQFHRSQEHIHSFQALSQIFANRTHFQVHPALPAHPQFADEGAANHNRLSQSHGETGVEVFVYGQDGDNDPLAPTTFPARQKLAASQAVARLHGNTHSVFLRQSAAAIDAGVFHNDVISVSNGPVFLVHEQAFHDQHAVLSALALSCAPLFDLNVITVPANKVSMSDAVESYLFNSQLLTKPGSDQMMLLVPAECRANERVNSYLTELVATENPIEEVLSMDLSQSMRNGGGPACLRLRVALTREQHAALGGNTQITSTLFEQLSDWVKRHYRTEMTVTALAEPELLTEVTNAFDELSNILELDFLPF